MRNPLWLAALIIASSAASAETLTVEVTLPTKNTAEYHRPYLALWISDSRRQMLAPVALWVQKEKWWRDLRSWWRRGGAQLPLPIDGVSGATRKPGTYTIHWQGELPAGELTLNVEAVREVGGREHIRLALPDNRMGTVQKTGSRELGLISATITQ